MANSCDTDLCYREIMVTNLKSIEVSLEKLSICPAQIVTIWLYGAVQQVGYLSQQHKRLTNTWYGMDDKIYVAMLILRHFIKMISRVSDQKRRGRLEGPALCSVLTVWLRYQGLCLKLEDQSSTSTTLKSRPAWRPWSRPNYWASPRWGSSPAPTCWRPSSPSTSSSGNRRSGRNATEVGWLFLFLCWRSWTVSWLMLMLRWSGWLEAVVRRWWWQRASLNNPVLTSLVVKLPRIQMILGQLQPPPCRLMSYPNRWKEKSRQPSNRDRRNTGKGSWRGWRSGGWRRKFSWLEFRIFCIL